MEFIILLLSGIIGLLHLVIMGLEMFAPAEKQAKTFAMPMKFVIQKNAQIALKNMGIYNGSLGLALLTSLLLFQGDIRLKVLLLLNLFVVIVGLYGGKTVTKSDPSAACDHYSFIHPVSINLKSSAKEQVLAELFLTVFSHFRRSRQHCVIVGGSVESNGGRT